MTIEFGVLALAVLVGLLVGSVIGRRARDRAGQPSAKIFAFILEPIYFWCDLYGPDGRPSRSKVAYFITLMVVLAGLIRFGMQQVQRQAGDTNGRDLSWTFLAYVLLVLVYSLGPQAFNAFLSSRLGARLGDVLRARASGGSPVPPGAPL
jgi:uncharacterized membrane protein YhaH (DUF805 family)